MTQSSREQDARRRGAARAQHFLEHERDFHLGMLPTEQAHPLTANLSSRMACSTEDGLLSLLSVDRQLPPRLREIVKSDAYRALVDAFAEVLRGGGRIFFSGCGATGRLSLILEAVWRVFWNHRSPAERQQYGDRVRGMITGGDRALVRSVEGFEDFLSFGRRQMRDSGAGRGDVVVAVSEGGETSSVIGSAWQAREDGARVFFVFNNPAPLLCRHVVRSRELIEAPGIGILDLSNGPMAIAGSTRLQAVTMETAVLGMALEAAITCLDNAASPGEESTAADRFEALVESLGAPENHKVLADLVDREVACYGGGGRVTYIADDFLLDIMQDTTERAPTFSLPPFRSKSDPHGPPSWAFIKHPCLPTPSAWKHILGRPPRGLGWTPEDYRALGAPEELWRRPPLLDGGQLFEFEIGNEPDTSRQEGPGSMALLVEVGAAGLHVPAVFRDYLAGFPVVRRLRIASGGTPGWDASGSRMACAMPASPLRLWEHLAVKLIFNTLSTACMVKMGYVTGNWMSRAEATNKKLVDRGIRLVAEIGGLPYREACFEFHRTLEDISLGRHGRTESVPPAMATLRRLGIMTCEDDPQDPFQRGLRPQPKRSEV